MQHIGVLLQQCVRHVRDLPLGLHGAAGIFDAERQHHLVLPQRDGVEHGGLDLFDKRGVVVLDHADLRRGLQRDHARQLQIVELLFEPDAFVFKIIGRLRILRQIRSLGLCAQLMQRGAAGLGQLLLTGQNIHGQLLEVLQVPLVHLIHHGYVLQQRDLVLFQLPGDAVDIDLRRREAALHLLGVDLCLAEQARDALLFRLVHRLELDEQAGEHIADLAQIAGFDLGQRRVGEICDVLLCGSAVFEDLLRVFQIDLLREGQHGLLLLLGERGKIGACLRRGLCFRDEIRFLFDLRLRLRVQIRRQGELGNVFVHNLFLLYLFVPFMQNPFCSSALRWPSFAPSRGYRR